MPHPRVEHSPHGLGVHNLESDKFMTKLARMQHLLIVLIGAMVVLAACGSRTEATPEPLPTAVPPTVTPIATPTNTPTAVPIATEVVVEPSDEDPEPEAATIVVAVNAEFKPFIFLDDNGNMAGFDVDLMNALSAAGNFEVGYQDRPFEGMLDALAAGEYDAAISAITITDARKEQVDFTAPYFQPGQAPVSFFSSGQGLGVRTDDATITGVASLTGGVNVGVKRDTTGDEYASTLEGITIVRFDDAAQALDALVDGTVQAVIVDITVIVDYIGQSQGAVKLVGGPVTQEEYGIAVNKGRPDVRELLDAALVQIREDGTYDQIFANWFGSP